MQENLQQAQEELANIEVTGSAGGGMVEVTMNCRHEVRRVKIDPAIADDVEMVEDLVSAAVNDAVNRVTNTTKEKMAGMTAVFRYRPDSNCRCSARLRLSIWLIPTS